MKSSRLSLPDIAQWPNLMQAFTRAALGKRGRGDVEAYRANLEQEIEALQNGLLTGTYPVGIMRAFSIRDPKPRLIHAPCFRERVLHHALMAEMGPIMDQSLHPHVFACRVGKGAHAAVAQAQRFARRFPWYLQIDIRHYFPHIDHVVLLNLIARRFRDADLLALVRRIIAAHEASPGKGLPIGALTSQNFANFYLGQADRHITSHPESGGYVRYMDDLIWWAHDRRAARAVLDSVRPLIEGTLKLPIKQPVRLGRSQDGLAFCGFRIFPYRLLLSKRRKRRYTRARRVAESSFLQGHINARALQTRMDAALAITAGADSRVWRRAQLQRTPLAREVLEA